MRRALFFALTLLIAEDALAQSPQQPRPLPLPVPGQQLPLPRPTPQLGSYTYTARTAAVVRRAGTVLASGISWNCGATTCTVAGPWAQPGVSACAALAREVGRIVSYGRAGAMLDVARLAECNGAVSPAAPTAPAPPTATGVTIATARLSARGDPIAIAPRPAYIAQSVTTSSLSARGASIATEPRAPFVAQDITTSPLTARGVTP